jgi:hypothetical protein
LPFCQKIPTLLYCEDFSFSNYTPYFPIIALYGAFFVFLLLPPHFCWLGWGDFDGFGISDPFLPAWLGRF